MLQTFTTEPNLEVLYKVLLGFALGALIGLEREKARISGEEEAQKEFPGVRSFGFLSMIGAVIVTMSGQGDLGEPMLLAGMVFALSIIVLFTIYRMFVQHVPGITTAVVLAVAFFIGMLVGYGYVMEAIASSVFVTFMLAIKPEIRKFVAEITYEELLSALELGIILFVFSPLFFMDIYDPFFHIINIRILYTFFSIILTLSLFAYVLLRILGVKGLRYFSFFGGLLNSEATAVNIARFYMQLNLSRAVVGGVSMTVVAMMARNLVIAASLSITYPPGIREYLLFGLIVGTLPAILLGYIISQLSWEEAPNTRLEVESPLNYGVAFRSVAIYVGIFILTVVASSIAGVSGIIASSFIGGLVNAAATIFTVFALSGSIGLTVDQMIATILLASAGAAFNKIFFVRIAGLKGSTFTKVALVTSFLALPPLIFATLLLTLGQIPPWP